jgi:polyisoprenyl-phosphate glycosyltransferase
MDNAPDISIVVPVYGCDDALLELYERITAAVSRIPAGYELIFVDDRGPGRPWALINELAEHDPGVMGIRLSRNFGQHYAIMAGVDVAQGRWLVVMDCDLQDRPEEIPRLWAKAKEGFDVVVCRRMNRQDEISKRLSSRFFHWFFGYMTDQASDSTLSILGIYSRRVVDEVKQFSEQPRIFPLMVRWLGFETATIDIPHEKRAKGKSSYNFSRRLSLALDTIVSHSNKPLRLFVQLGFFMAFASFCFGLWLIAQWFLYDQIWPGWTSVMVSLFFVAGILLIGMGVLGIYLGRIFDQVKGRPLYVVVDRTPVKPTLEKKP